VDRIVACPTCGTPVHLCGVSARCVCGTVVGALAAPTTSQARSTPARGVAAANRKVCAGCGADVTFSQRVRDASGQFRCAGCADVKPLPPPLRETETIETLEALQNLSHKTIIARKAYPRPSSSTLIACASVAVLVLLGSAIFYITRPTWDDLNADFIHQCKKEADSLAAHAHPKEAYFKYKELVDFVHDRPLTNPLLQDDMAAVKHSMRRSYALAVPQIQQEEAAARARAEAQRIEAARLDGVTREEEVARARARELAGQRAAIEREVARQQAELQKKIQAFTRSPEYRRWCAEADRIVAAFDSRLAAEDSAYRGMSEGAHTARDLLAILVKIEGRLRGVDVVDAVDSLTQSSDRVLALEDSAKRATYENDQAFFRLLGIWCRATSAKHPELATAFSEEQKSTTSRLVADDSAPRAISEYTGASMRMLKLIVSAHGHSDQASKIVTPVESEELFEDSAWRAAAQHRQANMQLLLALFPAEKAREAASIQLSAIRSVIGDSSAMQDDIGYQRGVIASLHGLIVQR